MSVRARGRFRRRHPGPSPARPGTDVTVVKESAAQRDGLFGALVAAFALALGRGVAGSHTLAGRVTVTVVLGALLALLLFAWARFRRHPDHLEISDEAVRYVGASGRETCALLRQQGDDLCFVTLGGGRARRLALKAKGGNTAMPLRFFTRASVKRACKSRGWHFS